MCEYLLGVDIGTTNVKCGLFSVDSSMVSNYSIEYDTLFPKQGWAEQNPNDWFEATIETIKYVIKESKVDSKKIGALSVSSQAPALVPIDKNGALLSNGLIWMDKRSIAEADFLEEKIGTDWVRKITGQRFDPYYIPSKLLWYKNNKPELYKKTHKILQVNGYINFKLTGRFTTDISHATLTGLFDVKNGVWSKQVADRVGYDMKMLPDVCECSEVIGTISNEIAYVTGLSTNTVVVGGAIDAVAACVEAGCVLDGDAVEMTGTSTVLCVQTDEFKDPDNLFMIGHAFKDKYILCGTISNTGSCLKWYRDTIYKDQSDQDNPYIVMNKKASCSAPGSNGLLFLPYLAGERTPIWDCYSRGMYFGLRLNTSRSDMIRSIMEGTAFALRHNIQEAEKTSGKIESLYSIGGGSKSDIWLEIKASILGIPIVVPKSGLGAPLGNAIIAGAGIGVYKDPVAFSKSILKTEKTIYPNEEWKKIYEDYYGMYLDLYDHIKQDYKRLAQIGMENSV